MLAQQIRRLKRCREADEIVIATTTNASDDPIITVAEREGVRWFRGSEHDVLSRYVGAAHEARAEVVARITADCPLIDPEQTDAVITAIAKKKNEYDYASNCLHRTFPRGLDAEAFFMDTLERTNRMAGSSAAREHVTYFIYNERPDLFSLLSITDDEDNSDLRWTVDTPSDFKLVTKIYEQLDLTAQVVSYRDVLSHVRLNQMNLALDQQAQQQVW